MEVSILAFGIAKDIFSGPATSMVLSRGATVGELKAALELKYSRLGLLVSYMIAVNNEYAQDDLVISERDEIAIIPPVSGG